MGWGRMMLLGNWGQQMDIEEQRSEIERLRRTVQSVRRDRGDADLRQDIAELRLYVAVLVRMLVAKNVVTREELEALVAAVDGEDGRIDGRHSGPVA